MTTNLKKLTDAEKLPTLDDADLTSTAENIRRAINTKKWTDARREIAYLMGILQKLDMHAWTKEAESKRRIT